MAETGIELRVPRVRDGSYYPALLEPRRRAQPGRLAHERAPDRQRVARAAQAHAQRERLRQQPPPQARARGPQPERLDGRGQSIPVGVIGNHQRQFDHPLPCALAHAHPALEVDALARPVHLAVVEYKPAYRIGLRLFVPAAAFLPVVIGVLGEKRNIVTAPCDKQIHTFGRGCIGEWKAKHTIGARDHTCGGPDFFALDGRAVREREHRRPSLVGEQRDRLRHRVALRLAPCLVLREVDPLD